MHERIDILGVRVSAVNLGLACAEIEGWVKARRKAYVCVAPVSTIVECNRDSAYRDIVNAADMVTPDGMPVVWLAKAKGCPHVGRAYGPDLMRALCGRSGLRHYFFGGTSQAIGHLEQCLKKELSGINIVGMVSPPFRPTAQMEDQKVIAAINQSMPDILWVGLGSPKQDFWMRLHRDCLDVPVMVGVGAAFDFLAGLKPQAPRWMQRRGLEWLFRLICEPRRLWKRYLIGNSLFLFYLIKEFWGPPNSGDTYKNRTCPRN
ncbi:MAG: WecB/TagA/CpsF family glycosyltransferase [Candidatus Omnitrophica bacterium]|nr:WecB/TagA/CpsF family glycosyltransferase [Candidatus Omnitrophota bacterium]